MNKSFENKIFSLFFLVPFLVNFFLIYIITKISPLNDVSISIIIFVLILVYYFLSRIVSSFLVRKISIVQKDLVQYFKESKSDNEDEEKQIDEISFIADSIDKLKSNIIFHHNLQIEYKKMEILKKISSQVAHDIRSPLAALNMVTRDISYIPEDKRIIIRGSVNRIQDIANELLSKNREINFGEEKNYIGKSEMSSVQLISSLLDGIITEKRTQFRSKLGIEIEFSPDKSSYGLFAYIHPNRFKRVISNLVNNACEALEDKGKVKIDLFDANDKIEIKIMDNGKGIPSIILSKLGFQGETHGKVEGNGLGLYHAKESMELLNGSLNIESEIGQGTTITLTLLKSGPPSWFVPEIRLTQNGTVLVLDDDSTIHHIWKERFEESKLANYGINILHFSTPDQVINWVEEHSFVDSILFLFDYELLGQKINGIDLIEKLGIAEKAILVSSRYEEKNILERCQDIGVKLIPKSMAESVPIAIISQIHHKENINSQKGYSSLTYDAVYIDDDEYLRMGWASSAEASNIKLLILSSTNEFDQHAHEVSHDTIFYIDRELGPHRPKGEVWAKELYERGFYNIYLASGYEADYFGDLPWIKGFIGKEPPFKI